MRQQVELLVLRRKFSRFRLKPRANYLHLMEGTLVLSIYVTLVARSGPRLNSKTQRCCRMLSKCANPDCPTTLHYLREGKVFKVESDADLFVVDGQKRPTRKVEHFWLCGPCSETST